MLRSGLEPGTFVGKNAPTNWASMSLNLFWNIKLPIGTNIFSVKLYETDQSSYICSIFSFNIQGPLRCCWPNLEEATCDIIILLKYISLVGQY